MHEDKVEGTVHMAAWWMRTMYMLMDVVRQRRDCDRVENALERMDDVQPSEKVKICSLIICSCISNYVEQG